MLQSLGSKGPCASALFLIEMKHVEIQHTFYLVSALTHSDLRGSGMGLSRSETELGKESLWVR